mgnify:CR=1 FL=1
MKKIDKKLLKAKSFIMQQVVDEFKKSDSVDDQISPEKARSDLSAV